MEISSLVGYAAMLAASGGVLYYIRQPLNVAYRRIRRNLIHTVKIYEHDELYGILDKWLHKRYNNQYRDVEAKMKPDESSMEVSKQVISSSRGTVILSTPMYTKSNVNYYQEDNIFIIRYNGKRLAITNSKEKIEHAQTSKDLFYRKYTLSGILAKKFIDALLNEAVDENKQEEEVDIVKVSSHNSYGDWYSPKKKMVKNLDQVIIEQEKKDCIINDMEEFMQSEEWYKERGIPYKRGYLLYGPPGTGKTTLSLALAKHFGKRVLSMNLNTIEDANLPRIYDEMPSNSILLIEDIDKVFSGRDNVKADSKLSFSCLLNCMDGALYKHGLITIITTNHIEKLDPALIRAGRMDVKLEIDRPRKSDIEAYLTMFYGKPIHIEGSFDIGMSEVQEICMQYKSNPEIALHKLLILNNQQCTHQHQHLQEELAA